MNRSLDDDDVRHVGLDPAGARVLELQPGDVALWHLYTVHGSGPNRSATDRRLYINGYVKASMLRSRRMDLPGRRTGRPR